MHPWALHIAAGASGWGCLSECRCNQLSAYNCFSPKYVRNRVELGLGRHPAENPTTRIQHTRWAAHNISDRAASNTLTAPPSCQHQPYRDVLSRTPPCPIRGTAHDVCVRYVHRGFPERLRRAQSCAPRARKCGSQGADSFSVSSAAAAPTTGASADAPELNRNRYLFAYVSWLVSACTRATEHPVCASRTSVVSQTQ